MKIVALVHVKNKGALLASMVYTLNGFALKG